MIYVFSFFVIIASMIILFTDRFMYGLWDYFWFRGFPIILIIFATVIAVT